MPDQIFSKYSRSHTIIHNTKRNRENLFLALGSSVLTACGSGSNNEPSNNYDAAQRGDNPNGSLPAEYEFSLGGGPVNYYVYPYVIPFKSEKQDNDLAFLVTRTATPPTMVETHAAIIEMSGENILVNELPAGCEMPISLVDINSDSITDFVCGGMGYDANPWPGNTSTILLQNEIGAFTYLKNSIPHDKSFTHSIASGDINGDGLNDVWIGNTFGESREDPYILINSDDTTFSRLDLPTEVVSGGVLLSAVIIDLDDDQQAELVAVGWLESGVQILSYDRQTATLTVDDTVALNNPSGQLFENYSGKLEIVRLEVFDLNNDDMLDLIMSVVRSDYQGNTVLVYCQNADGKFEDRTNQLLPDFSAVDGHPYVKDFAVFDYDKDGYQDILVERTTPLGGFEMPFFYRNNGENVYLESNVAGHNTQDSFNKYIALDELNETVWEVEYWSHASDLMTISEILL